MAARAAYEGSERENWVLIVSRGTSGPGYAQCWALTLTTDSPIYPAPRRTAASLNRSSRAIGITGGGGAAAGQGESRQGQDRSFRESNPKHEDLLEEHGAPLAERSLTVGTNQWR